MAVRKTTSVHFLRKGDRGDTGQDACVFVATPPALVFRRNAGSAQRQIVYIKMIRGGQEVPAGEEWDVISAGGEEYWPQSTAKINLSLAREGDLCRLNVWLKQDCVATKPVTVNCSLATDDDPTEGVHQISIPITTVEDGQIGPPGQGMEIKGTASCHHATKSEARACSHAVIGRKMLFDNDGTTAGPWLANCTQRAINTSTGAASNSLSTPALATVGDFYSTADDRHLWQAEASGWADAGEFIGPPGQDGADGQDAVVFSLSNPVLQFYYNGTQSQFLDTELSCHRGGAEVARQSGAGWDFSVGTASDNIDTDGQPKITFATLSSEPPKIRVRLNAGKVYTGSIPLACTIDGHQHSLSLTVATSERGAVIRTLDWPSVPDNEEIQCGAAGQKYIDAVVERLGANMQIYLCIKSFRKSGTGIIFGLDTANNTTSRADCWESAPYQTFVATKLLLADRIQSQYIDVASLIVGKLIAMLDEKTLLAVNREGRGEIISYYKAGEIYYNADGSTSACPANKAGNPCLVADHGVIRRYDYDGNVVATFGLTAPSQQVSPSWLKRQVHELVNGTTAYTSAQVNAIRTSDALPYNQTVYLYQRGNTGTNQHPQNWCGYGTTHAAYTGCFTDIGVPFMNADGQNFRNIYIYANGVLQRTNTVSWNPM